MQNRSVCFYSTNILRQLYMTPLSEYVIAVLQTLWGDDRFSNIVQWMSMVGSLVGVSLIAKELRFSKISQILVVVFCASIPMGILQASSTQTDYVVSFLLVASVYSLMRMRNKFEWFYVYLFGVSVGLSLLAKPTAYLFSFPFVAVFLPQILYSLSQKGALRLLGVVLGIILLLNVGFYYRNLSTFGWVFGPKNNGAVIKEISAKLFLSNVVKNISFHIATPFQKVNDILYGYMVSFHKLIGLSVNDRRITFGNTRFSVVFSRDEDAAGNALHFALILISIMISLFVKEVRLYSISVVGGYLLFCYFLKWQPWGSRLQLPLFVLSSPLVGAVVEVVSGRFRKVLYLGLSCVLTFYSFPWLVYGNPRPLFRSWKCDY